MSAHGLLAGAGHELGLYAPTVGRYLCVLGGIGLAMWATYRLARRLGAGDRSATGIALVTPWVLGLVLLTAFPMLYSMYLSTTRYSVLQPPEFVGADNYTRIFTDDEKFLAALRVTGLFTLFATPIGVAASLMLALLLSLNVRGLGVWRLIYYMPSVLPPLATALLWNWMLNVDGLVNKALLAAGLISEPIPWFDDPTGTWVIPAFVVMSLQGAAGNNMLIFLAGIKSLPRSPYEAALIDGAGWRQRFRYITLPLLSPLILYQTIMGVIGGLQVFTQPMFIRTRGDTGLFYTVHLFSEGWHHLRMGYACALAWVLFVIILILTAGVLLLSKRFVYYESEVV